jgi:uroporphyrinogen decarboxylase
MTNIINTLVNRKINSCFPIWFMRQAGRYLPEFRNIRLKNTNFIKLCLNSSLSSEITLQPIKRFNLDAAIIFSDILIVPYSLGQQVNFIKDKGPILSKFDLEEFQRRKDKDFIEKLEPVYKNIRETRTKLEKNKTLISFVGSPWTLIVYMFGLKKEKNVLDLKKYKEKKKNISQIMEKITKFILLHIKNQILAGADIVQIFDSWAGLLPEDDLLEYCYKPNKMIVDYCRINKIPTICFPKGIKNHYIDFFKHVNPDGINIDYDLDPNWALENLKGVCLQGGMNPKFLLEDEKTMFKEADKYLKVFKNYPYIFNLGHGLLPETNPDKLEKLINYVRKYR